MKRRYVPLLVFALCFAPCLALGGDQVCTVAVANEANITALCNTFQANFRIADSDWSLDKCTTEFMERGAVLYATAVARRDAAVVKDSVVRAVLDDWNSKQVKTWTRSSCGDGSVQSEYGETCDDGNLRPGDGCDADCKTEI